MATCVWWRVCATRETHRWNTGSQYGRKPDCKAVATDERHCGGRGRGQKRKREEEEWRE